jgi:hypothetical protein
MKAFWAVIISFVVSLTVICFWLKTDLEQQADIEFDQMMDSIYNQKLAPKNPEYCRLKCNETGLVCILDEDANIIDTFTEIPTFDSLLINHSKIPLNANSKKAGQGCP